MKIRNLVYYLNRNRHNFCGEYALQSRRMRMTLRLENDCLARCRQSTQSARAHKKALSKKAVHSLNCGSSYSDSPMRRTEILCFRVENWRNIELPASHNHLQNKELKSRRAFFVEHHLSSNQEGEKAEQSLFCRSMYSDLLNSRSEGLTTLKLESFLHPPLHFSSPVQQIQCVAEFPSQARKLWF